MKICGIDPGSKGAICVLDTKNLSHIAILDLAKHSIFDTANWLYKQHVDHIWIESVHSLHGMSAKSNFSFGKNLGFVITISQVIIQGDLTRIHAVTPKVWQRYAGVTVKGKEIKNEVAKLAKEIFPTVDLHGKKGGLLDGRSDSLMIAYYGTNHTPGIE